MIPMWGFDTLDAQLERKSESYEFPHPNRDAAAGLLTGSQNLKQTQITIVDRYPEAFDDTIKLQHVITLRAQNSLSALYYLCKNHSYDASHGRLRYLLESYLLLRFLNDNPEKAKEKWSDTREQIRGFETDYEKNWERLETTEFLYGTLGNLKGEDLDDQYQELYSYFSNRGTHPHTIRSADLDGSWRSSEEHHLLNMGVFFLFGIAAKYAETFRDSGVYWEVRRILDPIFVKARLCTEVGLPTLFKDEFHKWAPERD